MFSLNDFVGTKIRKKTTKFPIGYIYSFTLTEDRINFGYKTSNYLEQLSEFQLLFCLDETSRFIKIAPIISQKELYRLAV